MTTYPEESLDDMDYDYDDGTMPANLDELRKAVVGRKIVKAQNEIVKEEYYGEREVFVITPDDGTRVELVDSYDCCAFTNLDKFLLHPELVDHAIMGVGTTEGFTKWHIYADLGDIMELDVSWSCGNPFYYGYGFDIAVKPINEGEHNGNTTQSDPAGS